MLRTVWTESMGCRKAYYNDMLSFAYPKFAQLIPATSAGLDRIHKQENDKYIRKRLLDQLLAGFPVGKKMIQPQQIMAAAWETGWPFSLCKNTGIQLTLVMFPAERETIQFHVKHETWWQRLTVNQEVAGSSPALPAVSDGQAHIIDNSGNRRTLKNE